MGQQAMRGHAASTSRHDRSRAGSGNEWWCHLKGARGSAVFQRDVRHLRDALEIWAGPDELGRPSDGGRGTF